MKLATKNEYVTHILLSRDNLNHLLALLDRGSKDPTIVRNRVGHSIMVTAEENAAHYADRPNRPLRYSR